MIQKTKVGFFEKSSTAEQLPLKTLKMGDRLFVVIDGQPFYRSSGENSGIADIWLPMIMCKDNQPYPYWKMNFPVHFRKDGWRLVFRYFGASIIKYGSETIDIKTDLEVELVDAFLKQNIPNELLDNINTDNLTGRIIHKSHLIISARLGGSFWIDDDKRNQLLSIAKLSNEEILLASTPIILSDTPEIEVEDLYLVNLWLINNGAKDICDFFSLNEEKMSLFTLMVLFGPLAPIYSHLESRSQEDKSIFLMDSQKASSLAKSELFKRFFSFLSELKDKLFEFSKFLVALEGYKSTPNQQSLIELIQEIDRHIRNIVDDEKFTQPTEDHINDIRKYCAEKIVSLDQFWHQLSKHDEMGLTGSF